jgi:hypothetical protein
MQGEVLSVVSTAASLHGQTGEQRTKFFAAK